MSSTRSKTIRLMQSCKTYALFEVRVWEPTRPARATRSDQNHLVAPTLNWAQLSTLSLSPLLIRTYISCQLFLNNSIFMRGCPLNRSQKNTIFSDILRYIAFNSMSFPNKLTKIWIKREYRKMISHLKTSYYRFHIFSKLENRISINDQKM